MCLESFDKEIDNCLFKTYQRRLSSFKTWNGKITPDLLASSGFYYTTIEDVCKCFYCGVEIYDWQSDDCPINEHYRLKYCDFVQCLWYAKYKKYEQIIVTNSPKYCEMNVCIMFIILLLLLKIVFF
jgi:hypothetical protein